MLKRSRLSKKILIVLIILFGLGGGGFFVYRKLTTRVPEAPGEADRLVQITTDPGAQGYPGLATDGKNFYISYAHIPHTEEGEPIFEGFKVFLEKYDQNWQLVKSIPNDSGTVTCDTNLAFNNGALYLTGSGERDSNYVDEFDPNLNYLGTRTVPVSEKYGFSEKQCDPTLLFTEEAVFVPYLNTERALRYRNGIQQFDSSWQPVKKITIGDEKVISRAEIMEYEKSKKVGEKKIGEVTYLNVRTAPTMVRVGEYYYFLGNFGPGFNAYLLKLDSSFRVVESVALTKDEVEIFNAPRSLIFNKDHFYAFYTHLEEDGNAHIYCQKFDKDLKLVAKYPLTSEEGMQTYPQVIVKGGAFYMVYEAGPMEKKMINEKRDSDIFVKIWEGGF